MAMTAQDYKIYKSLDPSELTDEERKDIIDYERAEAKAPSLDDVQWATDIHNMASKNPSTLGRELKESGDYQKALDILNANRAYTATMGTKTQNAYVQPVRRIPDDLIKENGFNFNWKSAYENIKGEKLRDTEADYDKLQKFIDSQMYKEGDDVNLQKIAYDMHMYNPNTMRWSEFINSEQGKEFRNYIKDVEKNQRAARIKDIFDNESNFVVDFTLPVSKEYAKQQLLQGKDPQMGLPILTDQITNALMFGGNKAAMVAAPAVKNIGDVAFNDVDPAVAGINTLMGAGSNVMTPRLIQRGGKYFTKPGENYTTKVKLQARVDDIAKKVAEGQDKVKRGAVYNFRNEKGEVIGYGNELKKVVYTNDGPSAVKFINEGYTVKPLRAMPKNKNGVVSDETIKYITDNKSVLRQAKRSDQIAAKNLRDQAYRSMQSKGAEKTIRKAYEKYINSNGDFNKFELGELYALGYDPMKETFGQFAWRMIPDLAKNYGTNFFGRGVQAGGTMTLPNLIAGQNLNEILKNKKEKKPTISEIFGN